MSNAAETEPRTTALAGEHESLGGRMVDFAGWMMPLRYGSALDEHHAVRNAAGLFDLSHMAEIDVAGAGAAAMLDYALIGHLSKIAVGRAKYSMLCNQEGFVVDDLVVYRRAADRFLVVANASNHDPVLAALLGRAEGFDVTVTDETETTSLIAIQGPKSEGIVAGLLGVDLSELGYYRGSDQTWASEEGDVDVFVARTGYTGEDGFELYIANEHAAALWRASREAGESQGLVPVGLAARDTLRLEAGMALYGNELDLTVTPFDAAAGKLVAFDKDSDFVGRAALKARRAEPHAELIGLRVQGSRPAREGYAVHDAETGEPIGVLTSGTLSPTLGVVVALARLNPGTAERPLSVDVRGTQTEAEIVSLPFYKRSSD